MKKAGLVLAILALGGCDAIKLGFGNDSTADPTNMAAPTNQTAALGGKPTGATPTQAGDAGVTTSRTLQQLSGNSGGKVPSGDMADGTVDAGMLIGSWTDNGNCDMAVEFLTDGTFRSYNGGGGDWRLDGDTLTLSGDNGDMALRLRAVDGQTILATNPNGSVGRSTRC